MPATVGAVPGLAENLRLQDRVAQRLKARRHEHGALELETIEVRTRFDGDAVSGLTAERRNRAKELIEDFMIAANGAIARFLESRRFPVLRRVVSLPERWPRITEIALGFGQKLPSTPDAKALNDFLLRRRSADPLRFADLSLAVIKLLGRGEYAASFPGQEVTGHFGLAVSEYTHSTAPNILKYVRMGASSNFGNMFSVLGASAFVPMAPIQILTNNLLYDCSQVAIPTDDADPEQVAGPRPWSIGQITRYILFIGPCSSVFDYAIFFVMLSVVGCWDPADASLFQTGWFVESLLTQTLIIHVIRTNRIPFLQNRLLSSPFTAAERHSASHAAKPPSIVRLAPVIISSAGEPGFGQRLQGTIANARRIRLGGRTHLDGAIRGRPRRRPSARR